MATIIRPPTKLLALTTMLCWFGASPLAERLFRAQLNVQVHFITVDYGDQRVQGQAVILRGEPLAVDIGLVNYYEGPRAAAEADWLSRVSIMLRPGSIAQRPPNSGSAVRCEDPVVLRTKDVRAADDHVILDSRGEQIVRCRIKLDEDLAAGRYTLTVEWSSKADLQRFADPVRARPEPAIIEWELREVAGERDELDLYNHLAYRALYDRRKPDEALELIERVLSRHPRSTTALILRGQIHSAQGACRDAAADWQRAATAMADGTDTLNIKLESLGADQRRSLAAEWRDRAERLACPD